MDLVRRDALRGVAPRLVGETRGARDIVGSCSGDAEEGEVPQPSHPHWRQGKLQTAFDKNLGFVHSRFAQFAILSVLHQLSC